jgi:hypothetical protein
MIEHRDGRFYEHSNAHIHLSNDQLKQASPAQVLAATIHATSRFGAWVWATSSATAEDYQSYREKALKAYLDECRRQFEDHYNDHVNNFDRLLGRENNAG